MNFYKKSFGTYGFLCIIPMNFGERPLMKELYRAYSTYLKDEYGEKVYKLPVNLPGTCPNRDGKSGLGGCYFCSAKGAGFESLPSSLQVASQLEKNKVYIGKRYGAKKFIAYFQNYTNTYMSYKDFRAYMEAACVPDVVELDISTRPDCIDEGHLNILKEIEAAHKVNIVLELGLQTTNEDSLRRINRGHGVDAFVEAVELIHGYGFKICTHLIMNLPWDDKDEPRRMAELMNRLSIEMVKLHSLYIAKDTVFAHMYERGEFEICSMEDYVSRVVDFLVHTNGNTAVQRLVGRAPKEDTVFCNWSTSWWKIKDMIEEKMLNEHLWQGKMIDNEGSATNQ